MLQRFKPKSEFAKNVLTLMTGTSIAQAIPIAISPILTRLYTPQDFGVFALYMSIASMISVAATGRYEMAIMLPARNKDAVNILALSIIIAFVISFLSFLLVFIFNSEITYLLGNPKISIWLYFIPMSVFITGIYQSFNYWSNRQKQYKRLATSRILQSCVTGSTNLGLGVTFNSAGLVIGGILGQLISTIYLVRKVFLKDKKYLLFISRIKIFILAKKYIKFPTWNLFASVINMLRLNLIIIFLSKYFLSTTLGYYYFADKLLRSPSNILIAAFSDVYYQRLSVIKSNDEIYTLSFKYLLRMLKILLIPYVILLVILKSLVPIVFGENWLSLYIYLYILSVPIFFNIIVAHFSKILIVINRQEVSFYIHFYKMIGLLVIIFFLYINKIFTVVAIIILAVNEILWLLIGVIVVKNTLNVSSKGWQIYILALVCIMLEYLIYILLA